MELVQWQTRPNIGGGRSIEIPWITRNSSYLKNGKVADFGCLVDNQIGTSKYRLDASNITMGFDIEERPEQEIYRRIDLMSENFYPEESFDLGICVSVLEHVGLRQYHNRLDPEGDLKALRNMYSTIRKGGTLLVTVPSSDTFYIIDGWIKSYTPTMLSSWEKVLDNAHVNVELFFYNGRDWFSCMVSEFKNVHHYSGGNDIVGLACVKITRGV